MGLVEGVAGVGLAVATNDPVSGIPTAIGIVLDLLKQENARIGRWWRRVIEDPNWETPQEVQGIIEQRLNEARKRVTPCGRRPRT